MRVSWRNLDWVAESARGEIEKKLAQIGGEGSSLLDRVDFVARDPATAGAPFEVRISGAVAKNQITAVRREGSAEAAFRAALDAFERSAMSVWSMRAAPARLGAPVLPAVRVPVPVVARPVVAQPAALVARWRPDLSLPRLNLSLDRQALFERLAQPTRGAWRVASSLLPQPAILLRRALSRQSQRDIDRNREEALEGMSWRERLAALATWNEVEAAERWAREQVFARRYHRELQQGPGGPGIEPSSPGWRERIADLALWNELEAAERWAREQVLARLGRAPQRELGGASVRQLPARSASRRRTSWRGRLADLSLWDSLEAFELRLRERTRTRAARDPRAPAAGLFARISRSLAAVNGLASFPVRAAALGTACVVGLLAFQGVSNAPEALAEASLEAAYSAVSMPASWAASDTPFSAVAVPLSWALDVTPFSAIAAPGDTEFAGSGGGDDSAALGSSSLGDPVAFSAVALPDVAVASAATLADGAALRD
jgi:hypothetical protein